MKPYRITINFTVAAEAAEDADYNERQGEDLMDGETDPAELGVELASAWMEAVDRAERTNSDEDWVRADQLYRTWKRADLMVRERREDR